MAKIVIEDCDFIFHRHNQPRGQALDPIEGVVHSDDRCRVWKMFDVAATPEKGKMMVRVDLWPEELKCAA